MTQHWELGVQRDSMQLQQLRQSHTGGTKGLVAGGTKGLVAGDALLGQLEHINDEIASMEATIEYRADNLVRDVGRPGTATATPFWTISRAFVKLTTAPARAVCYALLGAHAD